MPDLLARVDASPGCSVKDSFGALDLGPYGFRVLFEAHRIARRRDRGTPQGAAAALRRAILRQ